MVCIWFVSWLFVHFYGRNLGSFRGPVRHLCGRIVIWWVLALGDDGYFIIYAGKVQIYEMGDWVGLGQGRGLGDGEQ
jgi:hypothetical protein